MAFTLLKEQVDGDVHSVLLNTGQWFDGDAAYVESDVVVIKTDNGTVAVEAEAVIAVRTKPTYPPQ
jgi:hypothetical protein